MTTELQHRVLLEESSTWGAWKECHGSISMADYSDYVKLIEVRVKPLFEPGYFEANDATHTVRWFEVAPNDPIWRRVSLVHDEHSSG